MASARHFSNATRATRRRSLDAMRKMRYGKMVTLTVSLMSQKYLQWEMLQLAITNWRCPQNRKHEPTIKLSVSTPLKVYQTDFEIAALFVMPESELLISFKLLTPLARVDKCTGRLYYVHLHSLQSENLQCSARFNKIQRMHTSDGDKAQSLGSVFWKTGVVEIQGTG